MRQNFFTRTRFHVVIAFLTLALFAFPAVPVQAQETGKSVENMIYRFQEDRESLNRTYSVRESEEYYNRMTIFYDNWLRELSAFNFNALRQPDKVDFVLLRNTIEERRYTNAQKLAEYLAIKPLLPFSDTIMAFVVQRRHGAKPNAQELAARFFRLAESISTLGKGVQQKPKIPARQATKAANATRELKRAFDEAYKFYAAYDPLVGWWAKNPHEKLLTVLEEYASALQAWTTPDNTQDDGTGITGLPLGREEFIKSLQFAMIPYTPDELIATGNAEFAWCEREMLRASEEMGFGANWKAALEKVKNDFVPIGEQPAFITFLAEEAIDYVEKNNLLTIPPLAKETWRMSMLTAEQQRYSPFFLGGELIQVAYPTDGMRHDEKMMSLRGNNKHFARATVFHELIPGHHLQMFMMNRHNRQRDLFDTPFWMEGWALYWEMQLWDRKFTTTPEDRVCALFWRMHRCARIVFSVNYHLGKWTPKQCIDFLVEKVGHERANAEAEVRRSVMGGYGPLYQLAYMIGAKQFIALRKEFVESGKMAEKDFHDAILRNGNIPIEMTRALLSGQEMPKDFKTAWRFLGQ